MKKKVKRKTILIAGAGGYIGSKMVYKFLQEGHKVIGLDRYFFGEVFSDLVDNKYFKAIKDDIRFFDENILKGVDVVINVAAISNDPAAELNPEITRSINYLGALRLAEVSKKMGVSRYILSSSCSVYGAGKGILTENSELAPISEYAKSKINAEREILELADRHYCVTSLRLATVYGLSVLRMRFDLIVNLMTLYAWKNKKIYVMGGGNQWRPIVHIDDAIRAFETVAVQQDSSKINSQIFNIGSNDQNYQVYQVASMFKKFFSELEIEVVPEDPDPRDYNVSFDKAVNILGYEVTKNIEDGILEIKEALENGVIKDDLRTITFKYYQYLLEADKILSSLKLKGELF